MIEGILSRIFQSLEELHRKHDRTMASIDDLNTAVTALQASVTGAVTEIQTLASQISTANTNNDSAAVEAASQQITTLAQQLSAAVTSAAPTPVAQPAA